MEYLNHDPNWFKAITIEIYKFLINPEYINFFIQMYMQCSKDDGSTSFSQTLIIPRLPHFEKLALSQFQLYIEAQKMISCFVLLNCKKTVLVRYDKGKETIFCILHMLRIHTGLRKCSKRNIFDLHPKKMNPFAIHVPYIYIVNNELLFEQYIMDFNQEKYDIEVQNDDAIKRNQILFDFVQRTFNRLDGLYLREIFILIDAIMKDQLRKKSAAEIEKLTSEKNPRNKIKEGTSKPSPKRACFENKTTRTSRATSNNSNSNFISNITKWS